MNEEQKYMDILRVDMEMRQLLTDKYRSGDYNEKLK